MADRSFIRLERLVVSRGIAKFEGGFSVAWAAIHDGDKCAPFFGSDPIPDPLPEGYIFAESFVDSLTEVQVKRQEVAAGYDAAMVVGYDTGLGFSLKLAEQDQRVLFDYQQRLLRQLSKPIPEVALTDIKPLMGTDNLWHLVTVQQIIDAIDGGAGHIESLNGVYAGYEYMLGQGVTDFVIDFSQQGGV